MNSGRGGAVGGHDDGKCEDVGTVIGDTVNTASRLQGLTRTLKTPLVVAGPLVDRGVAFAPVPEPSSLAILAAGLLRLGLMRRRRTKMLG